MNDHASVSHAFSPRSAQRSFHETQSDCDLTAPSAVTVSKSRKLLALGEKRGGSAGRPIILSRRCPKTLL